MAFLFEGGVTGEAPFFQKRAHIPEIVNRLGRSRFVKRCGEQHRKTNQYPEVPFHGKHYARAEVVRQSRLAKRAAPGAFLESVSARGRPPARRSVSR
jgi:hypothetical protein